MRDLLRKHFEKASLLSGLSDSPSLGNIRVFAKVNVVSGKEEIAFVPQAGGERHSLFCF
jgi:hypothetical protein